MTNSRFYETCPRKLKKLPCSACPLALERITAIQGMVMDGKTNFNDDNSMPGCPWYIASADFNYCFWVYAQTLQGAPASDREICDLLLITPQMKDKILESAYEFLKKPENISILNIIKELVAEISNKGVDYTIYLPSEFKQEIQEVVESTVSRPAQTSGDPPVSKKNYRSLPLHRDGTKVDLYGLYSKKALENLKGKRIGADGNDKEKQKKEKNDKKE